jgi:hypothetical protein
VTDEDALFEVWWALHRTKRWRETRPDMGPEPSPGYMEGLKDTAKLGWMARANMHVTYSRPHVGTEHEG